MTDRKASVEPGMVVLSRFFFGLKHGLGTSRAHRHYVQPHTRYKSHLVPKLPLDFLFSFIYYNYCNYDFITLTLQENTMVKFVDINPEDIDTTRTGRRGQVSYPILKAFLERETKVSQLDLTGLNKNPTYLRSVLQTYIRSHDMPIKIFTANGHIHLMRLDLDNDNNPVEWSPEMQTTEGASGSEQEALPVPLDGKEVTKNFKREKGQTTK